MYPMKLTNGEVKLNDVLEWWNGREWVMAYLRDYSGFNARIETDNGFLRWVMRENLRAI